MKVKELVEDLKKANPEAEINFVTINGDVEILSIYTPDTESIEEIDPKSKILCIDLGTEEDDEEFLEETFGY